LFSFTDEGLVLIPGFWALLPAIPIAVLIWRRGTDRRRTLMLLLALIHIDLVIALTIFPIPIGGQEFYRHTRGFSQDNIIPFATIYSQLADLNPKVDHGSRILILYGIKELFGNAVALLPLAIYGPALWPSLRSWRRFALVAVVFAAAIELAQLTGSLIEGFTYRVTDIDDVILNSSGSIVAFFVWRAAESRGWVDRWLWRWLDPAGGSSTPTLAPTATPTAALPRVEQPD
jgi:glycopeptide antibiotics resistance protein